jgi:pyruvate carboxylase
MPNTMFQTLCRGVNLFGYRPYPQNVIRLTVREFAKYVDVWRVFDFMNYIPNMQAVFEEVQAAGKILEPCICFSTGPEHTDAFYVDKVAEILAVTGEDIILCIKNHGGLGTPKRMGELVRAIKDKYPELVLHYHGHNTDGNDIGRITEAVMNGANIVDAADHSFTGFYKELPLVQKELGNYWSVTPGSQILWTTAVANVQGGERYGNPSGDLRNLLLGKYGPFPFYKPADWIYKKVLGPDWQQILETEGGVEDIEDMDIAKERTILTERIKREPSEQELVLYLQHPTDAVEFFKFEEKFGKVYVLPPAIFLKRGGFALGEEITFTDHLGKGHLVSVGPAQMDEEGETTIYLTVDHHNRSYVRAPYTANVCEISVEVGQEVVAGDTLIVVEAMKMQTPVVAQVDGIVKSITVKVGDAVKPGAKMVKLNTGAEEAEGE